MFLESIKSLRKIPGYNQRRTVNIIEILSDIILIRARRENGQVEMFDYNNCNLRLRLTMWENILDTFVKEAYVIIKSLRGKITGLPQFVTYQKYQKMLKSHSYLRGIYDELIRFCKIKKYTECDQSLIRFNEKRKLEAKNPKEERQMFFKEFGGNIMEIVEYVETEIMPKIEYAPIATILEIKRWNNCLSLKKDHEKV